MAVGAGVGVGLTGVGEGDAGDGVMLVAGVPTTCVGGTVGVGVGGIETAVGVGGRMIAVGVGGKVMAVGVGGNVKAVGVGVLGVQATMSTRPAEKTTGTSHLRDLMPRVR